MYSEVAIILLIITLILLIGFYLILLDKVPNKMKSDRFLKLYLTILATVSLSVGLIIFVSSVFNFFDTL